MYKSLEIFFSKKDWWDELYFTESKPAIYLQGWATLQDTLPQAFVRISVLGERHDHILGGKAARCHSHGPVCIVSLSVYLLMSSHAVSSLGQQILFIIAEQWRLLERKQRRDTNAPDHNKMPVPLFGLVKWFKQVFESVGLLRNLISPKIHMWYAER